MFPETTIRAIRPGLQLTGPLAAAVMMLGSCASSSLDEDSHSVSVLYESANCGIESAQLQLLTSTESWGQLEQGISSLNPLIKPQPIARPAEGAIAVLVAWGRKPNAGYRLALTAALAEREQDTLELPVQFTEPSGDMITAQVLVSPCLVLEISNAGDVSRVRAGDMSVNLD